VHTPPQLLFGCGIIFSFYRSPQWPLFNLLTFVHRNRTEPTGANQCFA